MTKHQAPLPSRPELDSFYAAIQRRRLRGELFGVVDDAETPDYDILGEIGRGGMGIVYEAYHHRLERSVAIKRVRDRSDARMQRRLIAEARTMAKLAHPNIVAVYDIEQVEDTAVIVMEYVDGVTLGHWLSHSRPSLREIVAAFIDAGEGLIAAHAKGLVHGDFKPSNVMIDREARIRVMDFGLAQASEDAAHDADPTRPRGAGTPAYMAPEQLAGASVDAGSDQFAFCASLHRAISDRATVDDGAWPWLAQTIDRGLQPDPRQRHPSMRDLVDELRRQLDCADSHGEVEHEPAADMSASTRRAPRWPWGMEGGALGLSSVVVLGLLALLALDAQPPAWFPLFVPSLAVLVLRPPMDRELSEA